VSASSQRSIGPVSAVVCNYNGEGYLRELLQSLKDQTEGLDEVIVVDNNSSDGSLELVKREYPWVKVLPLPVNGGPCSARNAGMRAARNRWVLAVDNDAILSPDVLGKLRVAIESDSSVVMAQPRSVFEAEPGRVHYDGAHFHYVGLLSLRNFYRPVERAEGEGTLPVDGAIAIAILLDRDAVLEVGGYDEDFFILFEDYDLSQRLRLAGHVVLSVEDATVLHRGGTPGISFREGEYPAQRAFYHSRNRWLLLAKNHSIRTLFVSLPGLFFYEAVWVVFTLRSGHLRAYVRGKLSFLKSWGRTMTKRRVVQGKRKLRDRDMLVGAPLTFSPELTDRPWKEAVVRTFDLILGGWWRLARGLSG